MISPHFPPDSSAGSHRVRLLAPYLEQNGWEATVLTVAPEYYEGAPDPGLANLVSNELRVERVKALPARATRLIGVGDLGLRALPGLYAGAIRLLSKERFDALFITIYPTYPALLGPRLKRRFHIPFVIDYQDPWVGSWGDSVGGGKDSTADLRSRLSRRVAAFLEPRVVDDADAITGVSSETIDAVVRRNPAAGAIRRETIPIGGDPNDFALLRREPVPNEFFDPADGVYHIVYVGTLLPLGVETLRAFLSGVVSLRNSAPQLYSRLRIHFVGTSNQRSTRVSSRIESIAAELGLSGCVSDHPPRIDYAAALTLQTQASAILLMGSSEIHYTASKLYPALLARRPLLAIYHRASGVSETLSGRIGPAVRLVQYDSADPPMNHVDQITSELRHLMESEPRELIPAADTGHEPYSAPVLAARLARVFDDVARAVRS